MKGGKNKMEKKILKEPLIIGIVVLILGLVLNESFYPKIPEWVLLSMMLFGAIMILIAFLGGK